MGNDFSEKLRELQRKGWQVIDNKGKHPRVVSPGGTTVMHSKTPSCPHAINQFERDIRRVERRETPKQEEPMAQNHHPITPVKTPEPPKIFGNHLFAHVKALVEDGQTGRKIANLLNDQGYRMPGGAEVDQSGISKMLISNGFRQRSPIKGPRATKAAKPAKEPALRDDLEAILASNLDPKMQDRIIKLLIRDRGD